MFADVNFKLCVKTCHPTGLCTARPKKPCNFLHTKYYLLKVIAKMLGIRKWTKMSANSWGTGIFLQLHIPRAITFEG